MGDRQLFINTIRERCTFLHDYQSFKEQILEPAAEFFRSDASAVVGAKGAGFDKNGIYFGYPTRYIIEWTNQDFSNTPRYRPYYEEGPSKGYCTYRAQDLLPLSAPEHENIFIQHGMTDSLMTMFFSPGGQPLGIYGCNRFNNPDMISADDRDTFHEIAPHVFSAFLKYRRLLDIDFFNIHTMDDIIYGIITMNREQQVVCMNKTARHLLKGSNGHLPSQLPKELEVHCNGLQKIQSETCDPAALFRDAGLITPFGNALCFLYDKEGSKYVPEGTEGMVIIIDPRRIDRDKASALSPRELAVSLCLVRGFQDKEIAHTLKISEKTVQTYMREIFKKFEVSNRTEAAIIAIKLGLN